MNTVYILGAGFSRPLGGPLLSNLFTATSWEVSSKRFTALESDLPAKWAVEVYRALQGTPSAFNKADVLQFWSDAEEFLEVLEICAHGETESPRSPRLVDWVYSKSFDLMEKGGQSDASRHPSGRFGFVPEPLFIDAHNAGCFDHKNPRWAECLRDHVKQHPKPWLSMLLGGAKRMLAAECSAFFEETDTEFDKWSPYLTWLARLTPADTVVTFNYDLTLETIARRQKLQNVDFLLPGAEPRADAATVLKLHGSVDWRQTVDGVTRESCPVPFAVTDQKNEAVMGTPGPSKLKSRSQILESLWSIARTRLQESARIVFLGYRMPPTDAYARRFLAEATPNLPHSRIRIQIVLGPPEVSEGHALRLERIMKALGNSWSKVQRLPLGVEDYLDLEKELLSSE